MTKSVECKAFRVDSAGTKSVSLENKFMVCVFASFSVSLMKRCVVESG